MATTKVRKGKRMTRTGRWALTTKRGVVRTFNGTLLKTFMVGSKRIAVFSVPIGFK